MIDERLLRITESVGSSDTLTIIEKVHSTTAE
jgi:hypothetical protein